MIVPCSSCTHARLQAKNTRQIDQQLFKGFSFATTQFVKGATGGDGDFDEEDEDAFEGDANDAFDEAAATAPPRLEDQPWYKPGLSRQQIVDELKGKPAGTWLLRPSKTQPGCYVMSVTVQVLCSFELSPPSISHAYARTHVVRSCAYSVVSPMSLRIECILLQACKFDG